MEEDDKSEFTREDLLRSYTNLSLIYSHLENYNKALFYQERLLKI